MQIILAKPFPGTVAQGVSRPKVREMNELSLVQNQRPVEIGVLGVLGRREWVTSILATVAHGALNSK